MDKKYCKNCNVKVEPVIDDMSHITSYSCPLCNKLIDLDLKNEEASNPQLNKKSKPVIKCPYCYSTDCKKLSSASRAFSFGLFGFGSSKIGKQWHCNNCKSDF